MNGDCNPLQSLNNAFAKYLNDTEDDVKEDKEDKKTSRSCKEDGCEKRASYGTINEKAEYCATHKEEGMVDVKHKRCEGKNADGTPCTTQPAFDIEGGKGRFCKEHKEEGMVDVKHKSCLLCPTLVSNKAYQGYCYRCFIYTFPNNQIVRNHKTKERTVADYIREQFSDYTVVLDKRIDNGCSSRRPDIFIDFGEFILIIEIDENQHNTYDCSCENKRLMELFQDAGSRPMVMVRFNPDDYMNYKNEKVTSCWGYTKDNGLCTVKKTKQKEWQERLSTLSKYIRHYCENRIDKEVHVDSLFYDGWSL